jgi:hypothetical protein
MERRSGSTGATCTHAQTQQTDIGFACCNESAALRGGQGGGVVVVGIHIVRYKPHIHGDLVVCGGDWGNIPHMTGWEGGGQRTRRRFLHASFTSASNFGGSRGGAPATTTARTLGVWCGPAATEKPRWRSRNRSTASRAATALARASTTSRAWGCVAWCGKAEGWGGACEHQRHVPHAVACHVFVRTCACACACELGEGYHQNTAKQESSPGTPKHGR